MSHPNPKAEFEEMVMEATLEYLKNKEAEMQSNGYVPTLRLLIEELEQKYEI